jgi:hypothetical protein
MLVVPPAWAGCRRRPGVLVVLARGWADALMERERRATLAVMIASLPAGGCIIDRDEAGRERVIGAAGVVAPVRVCEALR